jgi:hypothetical protein
MIFSEHRCTLFRIMLLAKGSENRPRGAAIFRSRFKQVKPVHPSARKNFACAVGQISGTRLRVLLLQEGRIAIVTDVGSRMRWTRELRKTNAACAYGKDVWS